MSLQQRSGVARGLDGELPGRGPERILGGQSAAMEVSETRWEGEQDDSSLFSSINLEPSAWMDAPPGAAGMGTSARPLPARA
jgi:hypothetical protein